jgi:hypothetical protein
MTFPPVWDEPQLSADLRKAIGVFRRERITEPLDHYLDFYESAHQAIAQVMELTEDLTRFQARAKSVLTDPALQETRPIPRVSAPQRG